MIADECSDLFETIGKLDDDLVKERARAEASELREADYLNEWTKSQQAREADALAWSNRLAVLEGELEEQRSLVYVLQREGRIEREESRRLADALRQAMSYLADDFEQPEELFDAVRHAVLLRNLRVGAGN